MTIHPTLRSLLLLAATVLFFGQSFFGQAAHAQDADAVFQRLKAKYDAIDGLRASFTQTMTSAYTDDEASFSGALAFQGQQYRVETGNQTVVSDGKTTYIYLPAENQVLIGDPAEGEMASPSDFLLNYDTHFNASAVSVEQLDGQTHYKLTLTPKNGSSMFQSATIWLRDRDDIITRMELLDVNETTMTFNLTNVEINPRLDANTFVFETPDGAEVIDLRS